MHDSLQKDEFNEPHDLFASLAGLDRTYAPGTELRPSGATSTNILAATVLEGSPAGTKPPAPAGSLKMSPVAGELKIRPHVVATRECPSKFALRKNRHASERLRRPRPAWIEVGVGKGKVVYLAHRAGLTYTAGSLHPFLYHTVWADTGRDSLTLPLFEAQVDRELVLSEPSIVHGADDGRGRNGRPIVQPASAADQKPGHYAAQAQAATACRPSRDTCSTTCRSSITTATCKFDWPRSRAARWSSCGESRRRPTTASRKSTRPLGPSSRPTIAAAWRRALGLPVIFRSPTQPSGSSSCSAIRTGPFADAAAESLGRLNDSSAVDALVAQIDVETDLHCLSDEIFALAPTGRRPGGRRVP